MPFWLMIPWFVEWVSSYEALVSSPLCTMAYQFRSYSTFTTLSNVINILILMTKHFGIFIGSYFRRVEIPDFGSFFGFCCFWSTSTYRINYYHTPLRGLQNFRSIDTQYPYVAILVTPHSPNNLQENEADNSFLWVW